MPRLFCHVRSQQDKAVNQEGALSHTESSDILASRTVRRKFYCTLASQSVAFLLQQPEWTKMDAFSEPGRGAPCFRLGI